jgi:hypothetical protein
LDNLDDSPNSKRIKLAGLNSPLEIEDSTTPKQIQTGVRGARSTNNYCCII